jgi:hypothetical protein
METTWLEPGATTIPKETGMLTTVIPTVFGMTYILPVVEVDEFVSYMDPTALPAVVTLTTATRPAPDLISVEDDMLTESCAPLTLK